MRILHIVEQYYPSIGGMQESVRQISEQLVLTGHDVTVATSYHKERTFTGFNGVKVIQFSVSGNDVKGITGNADQYIKFLLKSDYDIITNFAAQHWGTDLMLPVAQKVRGCKVMVPVGFSRLYDFSYENYFTNLISSLKNFQAVVTLSEENRDHQYLLKKGISNIYVIPNGSSYREFSEESDMLIRKKMGISPKHLLILSVSSHIPSKGHSDTLHLFQRASIGPATLLLIGNKTGKECHLSCKLKSIAFNISPLRIFDRKKIITRSLSRKDTVAAFKNADLFLFTSKLECSPLVLFECLAAKLPFLSTAAGNAVEIARITGGGAILPTIINEDGSCRADLIESAPVFEHFCGDIMKRNLMAENGYNSWIKSFTWEIIAKKYEQLYIKLINNNKT